MNNNNRFIAFFGHHKAATMWICAIFHSVAEILKIQHANYWDAKLFDLRLKDTLIANDIQLFSYTNADYKYISEIINEIIGFHVVRDPRDIVVSSYFSHLYSHPTDVWPELVVHRKKLQRISRDKGLLLEMDFRCQEFSELLTWNYSNQNILEFKMEDITSDPKNYFLKIFNFLGLISDNFEAKKSITPSVLMKLIDDNDFSKKSGGRKPGQENIHHHYRKGLAGDWINYFKKEHIDYFKLKYNDLLLKLGYENTREW